MHVIAERILGGEDVCPAEINEYNASVLLSWINDTDTHHTKEDCTRGKNCVHAPGQHTYDWAMFLLEEMSTVCTCETHT